MKPNLRLYVMQPGNIMGMKAKGENRPVQESARLRRAGCWGYPRGEASRNCSCKRPLPPDSSFRLEVVVAIVMPCVVV